MTAIDRDQVLAALKDWYDDINDGEADKRYLNAIEDAIEKIKRVAALPAIPLALTKEWLNELIEDKVRLSDRITSRDMMIGAVLLRNALLGALPVLETTQLCENCGGARFPITEGVCQLCLDHEFELGILRAELKAANHLRAREGAELDELRALRASVPVLETKKETE